MHDPMNSGSSQELVPLDPRLHRKCETALSKAVTAFPELLARIDPDHAVDVIADLIKVMLCRPQSGEKEDGLQKIIERICGTGKDDGGCDPAQHRSRSNERNS